MKSQADASSGKETKLRGSMCEIGDTRCLMPEDSATPEHKFVVLASYENRHAAERMLASLRHGFREKARKGKAAAFVVSGNKDGSLAITQSRVLTAGDFSAALIRFSASVMAGFMGSLAALKGAKEAGHAVRVEERHVGSDDQRAHEILAQAGPHAAVAMITCDDPDTQQAVTSAARGSAAGYYWDGSLTDFLSGLEPGSQHDWVRTTLGEPSESEPVADRPR